jgi:hypothetical protein
MATKATDVLLTVPQLEAVVALYMQLFVALFAVVSRAKPGS